MTATKVCGFIGAGASTGMALANPGTEAMWGYLAAAMWAVCFLVLAYKYE